MNCFQKSKVNSTDQGLYRIRHFTFYFCLVLTAVLLSPVPLQANPDVYAVLPADTAVVQYATGDVDGDAIEEMAVLYISGGSTSLAVFKARSAHWSLWTEKNGLLQGTDGASPSSVEIVDVNGDGKREILFYYLTRGGRGMVSRILAFDTADPEDPALDVLLEDTIVPPGYPLLGSEEGASSITFLKMPLAKGDTGHRRVYCWDGERFEKCVEVPWIKP